ncbi:meteorin-like protein [Anthonomus grandis grandis]|uniref:meteorin-like protein n=1 Tax=Anthonomus grandis grandis TaxID=2921223 RepID=UPI002166A4C9|nr:meteorin-like protein [Anthonomus grandis grandis]
MPSNFTKCGTVPICFMLYSFLVGLSFATIMGDECDWTGSGLSVPSSDKGVTPVYLRCAAGKIKWMYPRGALRILLRLPSQDRNFRACIKMRTTAKPGRPVTTIYLEGPRSLLPLYGGEGDAKPMRCFNSRHGQAAIYIEATDERSFEKQFTEIEYDLQQLPKNSYGYDSSEECRPCSREEMAHIFCTSDLVARGIIHSVENKENLEISQMTVKITKLMRHTSAEEFLEEIDSNDIVQSPFSSKQVTLNIPQHCGVNHGLGEFVFMARRKLGDLTLLCAPRLETWALLANKLNEEGRSHCVLRS